MARFGSILARTATPTLTLMFALNALMAVAQDPPPPPQVNPAPNRGAGEGRGPFKTMVIRYNTYGFGNIHEMELLQEAGFHPLEVIQAATLNPALTLHEPQGKPIEFGVVRPGLLADLVIIDQNPLENLKVLYGTGALKLNEKTGKTEWVGGIKWTIKDGIVYDAKKLLADVARMVEKQKQERLKTAESGEGRPQK